MTTSQHRRMFSRDAENSSQENRRPKYHTTDEFVAERVFRIGFDVEMWRMGWRTRSAPRRG